MSLIVVQSSRQLPSSPREEAVFGGLPSLSFTIESLWETQLCSWDSQSVLILFNDVAILFYSHGVDTYSQLSSS